MSLLGGYALSASVPNYAEAHFYSQRLHLCK